MIILPAIDIKDGQCVRLVQGDFTTAHKVAEDPVSTAEGFAAQGSQWIHMVDLDGAKSAKPMNTDIFTAVKEKSGLRMELGGGIRDMKTIAYYLEHGIDRVILGSIALKNPALIKEAVEAYGNRIAVGIDAKKGMVATEGWLDTSDVSYLDLAKTMEQSGVKCIIFTDISRDGTLTGPNLEQLDALNRAVDCDIIASGGIKELSDIRALMELGLYGAICGKSLYQGTLDLKEAIETAGEHRC
ncbi:1-(5-phosphoribosyl)-5-[(5-phosphoribosylamino)methylideneamino]imidazole-4-carboxamide isomerase [Zongyangia hominis]|uniref:1-(5-phosphoribosyl)-5-[(5-phosphoribosylamino)methylideneamino] imidazole-4-carboxamide isomerase n=1 Tax=Zongyangia hominis TaxID=2763677 RepID=A0A926EAX5_9FIRM|nr:1-(5-phosphoribosyl)-5-[(5-phosphoribosylamino)methylideneamino]imidazole-4-carboxamide isomerase [Zongyangia hominis]MBC8569665.1 1-(5-phosphoribosyl)-5-[(5-phosphoribosylamino)methylideneamino]imidazole-4-carboxamide isomerase [Zongyangia hominis]